MGGNQDGNKGKKIQSFQEEGWGKSFVEQKKAASGEFFFERKEFEVALGWSSS